MSWVLLAIELVLCVAGEAVGGGGTPETELLTGATTDRAKH